ncbi:ABC transporter ATP-binding protein [Planomonospora parontospora]|uniref:ABC transporter ATP-binding protein n=1 Tax=Planomonospora parontospora TaxID=58119 RepID=UPI00166FA34B|nr:ATP-binding cassette domain-containing protein [Planomonospora parontospora]GGL36450.1 ABC transporter ATP-binding protein [Planomonospora parontospora subsp. antibiotica]GII17365.1 ABC transporter ATP-binding protein [Planomonospora parontospora subsp. antibiotica]
MINVRSLTKRYGSTVAVDGLSFEVRRGRVTGFLGPNGAGKSTTMRMVLGLDRPSEGTALIDGTPYGELRNPLRKVGALLDAKAVHGGRSARDHLLCLAQSNGLPASRVAEVLALTGLTAVARRRVGGFSLGMSQRLGIAAALLGDPEILMFDEPVNGLDPEGILWIRTLMRDLAAEGRAVFVSSHLMSEMAQTADHLVVIGRGRLIADTGVEEFIGRSSQAYVRVRAPRLPELARVLGETGGAADPVNAAKRADAAYPVEAAGRVEVALHGDHLRVTGLGAEAVGEAAAGAGLVLHELTPVSPSLEAAYMELTQESTEYAGARA